MKQEDVFNLMLDYFDKQSACMQAQINKIMEPSEQFQDSNLFCHTGMPLPHIQSFQHFYNKFIEAKLLLNHYLYHEILINIVLLNILSNYSKF